MLTSVLPSCEGAWSGTGAALRSEWAGPRAIIHLLMLDTTVGRLCEHWEACRGPLGTRGWEGPNPTKCNTPARFHGSLACVFILVKFLTLLQNRSSTVEALRNLASVATLDAHLIWFQVCLRAAALLAFFKSNLLLFAASFFRLATSASSLRFLGALFFCWYADNEYIGVVSACTSECVHK